MNFSIIVLHYNNIRDTINCIESLLSYEQINLNIIIVDNGSYNDTGCVLESKYKDITNVHVLISNTNLGFSKGNNLGYNYALDNFVNDFIILSNNDVTITQKDFFDQVELVFEKTNFSVCGPDVYNPYTKKHQSPFFINKKINRSLIIKTIFRSWLSPIFQLMEKKKQRIEIEYSTDACLHGSFLIFSKNYIEVFKNGLYSDVFMYGEELILSYFIQKSKLVQVYTKDLQINHFEGQTTKLEFKNNLKRYFFKCKNETKSLVKLLFILSYQEGNPNNKH